MKARDEIRALANKEIAKHSLRFFKTGKGEYGHGDIFLGVRTPQIRLIAKKHIGISTTEMKTLIKSKNQYIVCVYTLLLFYDFMVL